MRIRILMGGREREVSATVLPSGEISILIDGKPSTFDLQKVSSGFVLSRAGKVYDLCVDASSSEFFASVGADRLSAKAVEQGSAAGAKSGANALRIVSPMPGQVVRILVNVGDRVEAGQAVVVVEAMKMENELRAGGAAIVDAILVQEKTAVEKGALLIQLRPV